MKLISNLITFRHRYPHFDLAENELDDDGCTIQISRSLRPSGVEDYVTLNINDCIEVYFSSDEANTLGLELISAANYGSPLNG